MKYSQLAKDLREHLEKIINNSDSEKDLLFRVSGFYGSFQPIAQQKRYGDYKKQ
jgi:cytochrome c-type biogenesis protein CcmH/NrfF